MVQAQRDVEHGEVRERSMTREYVAHVARVASTPSLFVILACKAFGQDERDVAFAMLGLAFLWIEAQRLMRP